MPQHVLEQLLPGGLESVSQTPGHERCAQEPVQIIGSIQSHGLLFALSEPDLKVRQVSANVSVLLGISPQGILGCSFADVLGAPQFAPFQSQAGNNQPFTARPVSLPANNTTLETILIAHRQEGSLIVELEISAGAHSLKPLDIDVHIRSPLSRVENAASLEELSRRAAEEIRKISGFDRVMVYRFDEDWNGEVIAEVMSPSPVSYYGLRFPASDIPPQVRRLFLINPLRAIADVDSIPAPLVPEIGPFSAKPLDLTRSVLRSASPIHLEYLRNMGVQSSLTVSIVVENQLWGMIACHHPVARRIDHSARSVCELIGQTLASQIALRMDNVVLQARLTSRKMLESYMGSIEGSNSLADAKHLQSPRLLELFDADGLVSRVDGVVFSQGVTVTEELLSPVVSKLQGVSSRGIASSNMLSQLDAGASNYASQASGALYLGLGEGSGDYLLFLRRELVETVIWAGNPHQAVSTDEQDRLHPRTSFAAWHETVRGRCRRWSGLDLENASFLREQLLRVRDAQKLLAANKALALAREAQAVQAGRAEMAVTVLHDIGNAITGMGTRSAQLLAEPDWPETQSLARLSALLQSQAAALVPVLGERKATALGGLATALERNLRERESSLRDNVRSLVRSVSHVQDILSVQRQYAQLGGAGPRSRVVLNELVHDAIAIHATAVEKRAIRLRCSLSPDIPKLSIDRTRMVQVLGNLIRNACESFDRAEAPGQERRIEIATEDATPGRVKLTVKDNGSGFDPARAETLLESGVTSKSQGSGLGLASCRSAVEAHGGRISLSSEGVGKGATVTIYLPSGQSEVQHD